MCKSYDRKRGYGFRYTSDSDMKMKMSLDQYCDFGGLNWFAL